MGYFNEKNLEDYDREDINQNKKKKQNKEISTEQEELAKQRLKLEEKRYFARYGNTPRQRLYEYADDTEETDDLGYGR